MPELKQSREVRIHSLEATEDGGCVVLLEEVAGARLLPIFAGLSEAKAIALCVRGLESPRPMTHDLAASLIETLGGKVVRVDIHELRDAVFYSRISIQKGGIEVVVDARPSDAINIALRAAAPIFVGEDVFAKTGLVLKPIGDDEVARFKKDLETLDPLAELEALEGKPAPEEPGL